MDYLEIESLINIRNYIKEIIEKSTTNKQDVNFLLKTQKEIDNKLVDFLAYRFSLESKNEN